MVTATIEDEQLGRCLVVPPSIQYKIREKTSSSVEYRERVIEYYIQYSPYATWSDLAGLLYSRDYPEAVAAARRFIKRTPGKCMYTIQSSISCTGTCTVPTLQFTTPYTLIQS